MILKFLSVIRIYLTITMLSGCGLIVSLIILIFRGIGIPYRVYHILIVSLSRYIRWSLRVFAGIGDKIIGIEHVQQPCIIACKHQSWWETSIFISLFPKQCLCVAKSDIKRYIFISGLVVDGHNTIYINRGKGRSAMLRAIQASKFALGQNKIVVIFPEGTRKKIGSKPDYQRGIFALYKHCNAKVVPAALNVGLFLGKGFNKQTGTIQLEFMPAIETGLPEDEFMQKLQNDIETKTQHLVDNYKAV